MKTAVPVNILNKAEPATMSVDTSELKSLSPRGLGAPDINSVGRLARRGAIWSLIMHAGNQSINLTATMIVSRILLPNDFGLVAMVATLTAFLQAFSDFGLSWATIQKKDLSSAQVHNLFWINTFVGLVLCLCTVLAAPLVSSFYGRPELRSIAIVMSSSFVLAGLAAQPTALIKRSMMFKQFSLIVIGSTFIGMMAGVSAALLGAGFWALVVQIVTAQLFRTILILWRTGYRPHRIMRRVGTLSLVRFGGFVATTGITLFFAKTFDNVLIGRVLGSDDLGYYSRAYFIVTLPAFFASTVMTHVMVPSLSALSDDKPRMANAYRRAVSASTAMSFPISVGLAMVAPAAVRLVYGDGWQPVVPLLIWMSIAGLFQPVYETAAWLFVSSGKGRSYFLWTLVGAAGLLIGFTVGIQWGTLGVAIASAVLWPVVMAAPSLIGAHRAAGIDLRPTLDCLRFPLIASLVMATAVWLTEVLVKQAEQHWLVVTAFQVFVGATTYGYLMVRFWRPFPTAVLSRLRFPRPGGAL